MSGISLHYFGFALAALFAAASMLSYAVYKSRKSQEFLLLAIYFAMLLMVDFFVRDTEIQGALYRFLCSRFSVPALPMALCYCVMSVSITELTLRYLGSKSRVLTILCILFFPLWFVNMLLLKVDTAVTRWLYIFPYQILTFSLSIWALLKLHKAQEKNGKKTVIRLLRLTAVFSVLIVVEDTAYNFFPAYSFFAKEVDTTRNITENILQIVYSVTAICTALKLLSDRGDSLAPSLPCQTAASYAQSIGLSTREKEVFMLLLEGKNNQEISQTMDISLGTAKAHTHNIFQKSETENRAELLAAFDRYTRSPGVTKM